MCGNICLGRVCLFFFRVLPEYRVELPACFYRKQFVYIIECIFWTWKFVVHSKKNYQNFRNKTACVNLIASTSHLQSDGFQTFANKGPWRERDRDRDNEYTPRCLHRHHMSAAASPAMYTQPLHSDLTRNLSVDKPEPLSEFVSCFGRQRAGSIRARSPWQTCQPNLLSTGPNVLRVCQLVSSPPARWWLL